MEEAAAQVCNRLLDGVAGKKTDDGQRGAPVIRAWTDCRLRPFRALDRGRRAGLAADLELRRHLLQILGHGRQLLGCR
jgi:hypothetical protein